MPFKFKVAIATILAFLTLVFLVAVGPK